MVRHAVVAGQFYPSHPSRLKEMIAGMVDEKSQREDALGLILPHAGYPYSGPVAAAAISRIKFKETFIILGPNHTGMGKALSIMTSGNWETPLGSIDIDEELARRILTSSRHLEEDDKAHLYEHSIEVQLPFLQYFKDNFRLVPVLFSYQDPEAYKDVGTAIANAVSDLERDVTIIASSDMTHYESSESARRKDNKAIEAILHLDEEQLLRRVKELGISMCGYAPTVALIIAAKNLGATQTELVRYGTSGDSTGDYSSVVGYASILIKEMSPPAKLAKATIETYVTERAIPSPEKLTDEMEEKAGVFVSIHKSGSLRGCIGTFEPCTKNVAEEIIANAINAATRDPRFPPVSADELKDLTYNVDILTTPEPVEDTGQLDPKKYGIIVQSGMRRGLLLPDLEGVDTVDAQISICRQKAGIFPDEPIKVYRFRVRRYR